MSAYHRTSRWLAFSAKARKAIQPTLPRPCVDPKPGCPGAVMPTDTWDVAHLPGLDADRNPWMPLSLAVVGPAHRACNRSQGGRAGRAKQITTVRANQKLPTAESGW